MEKRSRTRLVIVTVIILGLLAILLYSATRGQNSLSYFKTVTELKNDTSLVGKSVRVGGEVVAGTIKKTGTTATFTITDKKNTITIKYVGNSTLPATLNDKVQVIAEGTYKKEGLVEADSLVTKCPSKYENKKIETK
jgi:cytochrome c-type biogenesis protein CcmE